MIKINLLPEERREKESSLSKISLSFKGQADLFRNLAIAALGILVCMHIILFFVGARSAAASKTMSQKVQSLAPAKREYDVLKAEVDVANRKAKAIDDLMANRFSWAKKLNELSDCVTQGIWLTDISYEEKPSEVSVQVKAAGLLAGNRKEIMKTETKKLNLKYLNISGYASSMGEQGTALIGKFIQNMKDNPSFFQDFSDIKLESIRAEKLFEQEVMSFKITCLLKNVN
ncbi:MAG: PilN domain-containing protein, partial [Candidatus Omnitrophica bacterium]|nr:PilN domain-containing protein [Candidatus Omnitrophota bacterium]